MFAVPVWIVLAMLYIFPPIKCQQYTEEKLSVPDVVLSTNPSDLVKRNSVFSGSLANDTMSQDGTILSLLVQIVAGVVQGMLNSQGITNNHVNNALNVFSPEKLHDDLLLFRKALNLALRFVTFIMRFLPRMSMDGSFSPLEFLKSKIAFYNTQPVSENGPFIAFNKIEPDLRPDVPERIQKVVDFAIEDAKTESSTTFSSRAILTDDDVRLFKKNSSQSNADSTTVINIAQFVNETSNSNLKVTKLINNEQMEVANSSSYPSPTRSPEASTMLLSLIRQQNPLLIPNALNLGEFDDLASDFGQIRRSRIVKKNITSRDFYQIFSRR
ncbi:hypothetical protein FQA39_LY17381 [Lamprigera yunnana]|nr:hypothetical protein FQA39_LY17381 [Lamprigera yunnana]